jgi:GNAT superfamily N-acetyltransferase
VRIRPAQEADLPTCGRIFAVSVADLIRRYRPEQEDQLPVDPEGRRWLHDHLLRSGAVFVAEDPDQIGFAAAIVRDGVWFLSQLWVLPDRQGSGAGGALLEEALAWGRGSSAFSVVASPHPAAQTLYLRSSMLPLWFVLDMAVPDRAIDGGPDDLEQVEDSDGPWIDELDREVRGAARPEDHAVFRAEATGLVLRRGGGPRGYAYVWPSGKVGPVAARIATDIPPLLRAGLRLGGGARTVSVPSSNWAALRELVALGARPTGSNAFLASRPLGDATRYVLSGGALG